MSDYWFNERSVHQADTLSGPIYLSHDGGTHDVRLCEGDRFVGPPLPRWYTPPRSLRDELRASIRYVRRVVSDLIAPTEGYD